jgi:hypothetical protein
MAPGSLCVPTSSSLFALWCAALAGQYEAPPILPRTTDLEESASEVAEQAPPTEAHVRQIRKAGTKHYVSDTVSVARHEPPSAPSSTTQPSAECAPLPLPSCCIRVLRVGSQGTIYVASHEKIAHRYAHTPRRCANKQRARPRRRLTGHTARWLGSLKRMTLCARECAHSVGWQVRVFGVVLAGHLIARAVDPGLLSHAPVHVVSPHAHRTSLPPHQAATSHQVSACVASAKPRTRNTQPPSTTQRLMCRAWHTHGICMRRAGRHLRTHGLALQRRPRLRGGRTGHVLHSPCRALCVRSSALAPWHYRTHHANA